MSKKTVLLVAGALVAAGTIAAVAAAPHLRGHRTGGYHGDRMGGGPRLAERLKQMDADKDGAITLEEFLRCPDASFARMDRNGDGFVDPVDLAASAKENAEYHVRRFLKSFDTNRDGKVTKEEFGQRAKRRFAMRDLNGDGQIGIEDMPPGMRERAQRRAERAKEGKAAQDAPSGEAKGGEAKAGEAKERRWFSLNQLIGRSDRRFARWDKNGDGVIDAQDLETRDSDRLAFATKRFLRRFDTNGDGKVSKDEFERFAKERFARLDLDDNGRITEQDLPPRMRGRGILK